MATCHSYELWHQWVYFGFKKSFNHIIEVYGFKRALEIWQKRMQNNDLPTPTRTNKANAFSMAQTKACSKT